MEDVFCVSKEGDLIGPADQQWRNYFLSAAELEFGIYGNRVMTKHDTKPDQELRWDEGMGLLEKGG